MLSSSSSATVRYGFAPVAVVAAVAARLVLDPILGDLFPFATLFLAVLVVAGSAGRGPAALAVGLGAVAMARFLLPPRNSLWVDGFENRAGLVLYCVVGSGIALLGGALRDARRRAGAEAAEAVRQREQVRITLASIGDAVIVTDAEGRVASLNPVAEALTGWASAEALGQPLPSVFRIVNEATRMPVDNPALRALDEGVIVGLANHTILIARDGEERPIDDSAAPIRDQAGEVAGAVLVFRDIGERKRAEAAVRRAGDQARTILESITDAFCALDRDWRFIYVNRQAEILLGRPAADLLGKDHWEEYPATLGTGFERNYHRAVAEQVAVSFEQYFPPHDRWYEMHAYPSSDGLSVYFRDVTARRRSADREQELAAEAALANVKFRAFFEQGVLLAGIVDVDGRLIEANRLALEACGVAREDVVGRPFWEGPWWCRSAEVAARIKEACARAAAGETFREEMPFFIGDGVERMGSVTILPLKDKAGRVLFLAPTVMDITERLLAGRRLHQSEERLRFALKAGRMGAWAFDFAERRLTCSDTCKANFGRGPSESFSGDDLASSMLDDDRPLWRHAEDGAEGRAGDLDVEYRTRWPDGSIHWVCVRASPVLDELGRTVAMSGVSFTIDERKRAEEALMDADRRKDEFLATLAHELRNPLAPIRNGLQIMRLAGDDRDAVAEARALMERQVSHMVRLIDDLLDVSRITQGKLELRRERAELAAIVRDSVEASRPLVEASGHELAVTGPGRPIYVDADATRLAQVFSNLLNNAAKYTEPGGKIALAVEHHDGEVVVAVRDNGVGIPAEMLPDVFGMFTQVDRSLERSQGGLGIGLTLVRTLVEMHGGTVEARSDGQGLGSEFVVRLPIVAAVPPRAPAGGGEPGATGRPAGRRILVVDDNRDSARTLARLLKLMGNETRTAHDGGEALEAAEQYRPEVMLLDIGLPVMNGYEVARTIRDRPWGRAVRIVALTGWGQDGDRRRSEESGIDDHLVKPVDPSTLEKLLSDIGPGPGDDPDRSPD